MSDLRIILLLIGVGIVAGVYVWTRFQQSSRRSAVRKPVRTPPLEEDLDATPTDDVEQQLARMEQLVKARSNHEPSLVEEMEHPTPADVTERAADEMTEAAAADVAEDIDKLPSEYLQVISIIAPEGQQFEGAVLHRALLHNKLRLGERGIYERLTLHGGRELPVFGLANLVKPGIFEPGDLADFSTPGVTLFLQLPCAVNAVEAFDDFVNTAERLAVEIGGELRDERHGVLTHQALMQVRERVVAARFRPNIQS
ncbi:MAG: cell division protein ZipA C-terminal FtsZ-binding domain-containing protein [Thiogranum sp.]|nr:cell division protein ZipA C-terminal FtsZ-binding domain-containing protein [Thiogranum sp.]